jgi:subtilisin family serine protease
MPDSVWPGRPFPDAGGPNYPLPDGSDRQAAGRQRVGLIGDAAQVRLRQLELNYNLIQRRTSLPPTRRGTGDRLRQMFDETGLPLLTNGEIVVRAADFNSTSRGGQADPMQSILPSSLTNRTVSDLDNEVVVLSDPNLSTGELTLVVEKLRRAGYQASMNQVEPLGYVTKANPRETGPEPTKRTVPDPNKKIPGKKVTVAVIDTGLTDQDRKDHWLNRAYFPKFEIDPLYEVIRRKKGGLNVLDFAAGHGTFVSGLVRQVAPQAVLDVRRVTGPDGIGTDLQVAIAMLRAFDAGADIINLSLGTEMPYDEPPVATSVALELIGKRCQKGDRDVVVVAAAGNNGNSRKVFPAAFSTTGSSPVPVVSVGGLSLDLDPAGFSSHGSWVSCSTTAECVLSTFVRGRESEQSDPQKPDEFWDKSPWAVWSGTSFAAAQVSGAIARRYQDSSDKRLSQSMHWLLGQGPSLPGYGTALEILPVR